MSLFKMDESLLDESLKREMTEYTEKALEGLKSLQQGDGKLDKNWSGWFEYPRTQGFQLLEEIKSYQDDLTVDFDLVLVIGIGGSYLGARAVAETLNHGFLGLVPQSQSGSRIMIKYAGHHLCERELVEVLELLEQRRPLINVISKSGTTTEPGVAFRVIRNYMEKKYGTEECSQRIVVTTDAEKGALKTLASSKGYRQFEVPDDIGGRYSVLSAVGMVPLALAGLPVLKIMEGAAQLFNELDSSSDLGSHPVIRYASFRKAAFEAGKRIELLGFAEPRMLYFAEWWKQLFGESEGKQGKGLFPAALCYTTDLHSLGQYAQDGVRNLIETFISFDSIGVSYETTLERRIRIPSTEDDTEGLNYIAGRYVDEINQTAVKATRVAHYDGGVPNIDLRMTNLDAYAVGALFAFFETCCAVSGFLLEVDPFDQPGVEDYKVNLFGLLGKPGFEELGEELKKRFSK